MQDEAFDGPPTKRRRLSGSQQSGLTDASETVVILPSQTKELQVGIQAFANPELASFQGVLKTRYTDFLVNEILPNGQVVHVRNTRAPKPQKSEKQAEPPSAAAQDPAAITKPDQPSATLNGHANLPEAWDADKEQNGTNDEITPDQQQKLAELLNSIAASETLALYQSIKDNPRMKASDYPTVRTEFTSDRTVRSQIHQFIRETFKSTIETQTDKDGFLVLSAARNSGQSRQRGNQRNGLNTPKARPGKLGWLDRGGEYLHFTLYKENKDTMEAISWLTKQLRTNAKSFQFAGTKDRRAVTSQRCSVYRIEAERLAAQNQTLRGSKVSDFEYHPRGLELGELKGNEFVITLRDCVWSGLQDSNLENDGLQQDMQRRMQSLRDNGYINYYGEQRFGTFSVRTDTIGRHILREDFKSACDGILSYQPDALEAAQNQDSSSVIGQDDKNRALAIHHWRTNNNLNEALDILPRKFSAEAQTMRHLTKSPSDYLGALLTIQRNLRLMYVHAYQSLVWNLAASQRIEQYGSQVVKGDLVLVNEHKDKEVTAQSEAATEDINTDADGEQIIAPADDDRAAVDDDLFERARALSSAEAESGKYSIFDIVLPQPGYDILYPDNEVGEFYKTYMSSEEGGHLDPHDMRRKHRDFSLSGSYRKVFARIGEEFDVQVHRYDRDDQQFVKTDLDVMKEGSQRPGAGEGEADTGAERTELLVNGQENAGRKIAVVLKFQLGASQYATMALRELSKGGISPHKPDFSGGR